MKENNVSMERKRKYNEIRDEKKNNVKNIVFQTKRDIDTEKKRLRKEKKEKKKLKNSTDKSKKEEGRKSTPDADVTEKYPDKYADEKDTDTGEQGAGASMQDADDSLLSASVPKHAGGASSHKNNDHHDEGLLDPCTPKRKIVKMCVQQTCTPANTSAVLDEMVTATQTVSGMLDAKVTTTPKSLDSSFNKTAVSFEAPGINVYQYAESRAFEIMNLQRALRESKFGHNNQVFQTLPRHMRRRAASHDIRRIPKRLRNRAQNQNEKMEPKKPTSRKYKRRPRNLMEEYNRRSKLHSWLETHMWHAKRFKMVDKWGYRVPEKPCDKAFRAIYRASAKSCLLQDKSYMEFIEIVGREEVIIKGFQRITNPNSIGGILLTDERCMSGQCYGEQIIYTHDSYPYDVIGGVKFIWTSVVATSQRKLLVICHPSISLQIMRELEVILDLSKLDNIEESVTGGLLGKSDGANTHVNSEETSTVHDDELKSTKETPANDNQICSNMKVYEELHKNEITDSDHLDARLNKDGESITTNKIKVVHHKLDFVLFSLTGPLSFQILQNLFTFPQHNDKEVKDSGGRRNCEKNNGRRTCWNLSREMRDTQCALYNLSVEDPRFHIPYKKQNPFSVPKIESTCTIPISSPVSLVWDDCSRKKVKEEKLSDEQINDIRYQQLIPGSTLPLESVEIPVVVIQRPSRSLQHSLLQGEERYGSGFDIILPSGWAMPFWIALVYQGARVGGVEADENVELQALSTHFPTQYPDSKARQDHVVLLHQERPDKHKRYPPDKRMNYDKLGIKHPFSIPWLHLVAEWKNVIRLLMHDHVILKHIQFSKCNERFYVLREKTLLQQLKMLLSDKSENIDKEMIIKSMLRYPDSVVCVSVCPLQGGIPKGNATLCIPTDEDIALLKLKKGENDGLTEPMHKGYKREFPYICKKYDILLPNAATIGGNTRWIVGYIQNGAYSYAQGKGSGIGFMSCIAFVYLLYLSQVTPLLFRNVNTLDYLSCNINILL